jgi:hypothetical protein
MLGLSSDPFVLLKIETGVANIVWLDFWRRRRKTWWPKRQKTWQGAHGKQYHY